MRLSVSCVEVPGCATCAAILGLAGSGFEADRRERVGLGDDSGLGLSGGGGSEGSESVFEGGSAWGVWGDEFAAAEEAVDGGGEVLG